MITLVSISMFSNNILMNKINYVSIMIWNDLQVACNCFFNQYNIYHGDIDLNHEFG